MRSFSTVPSLTVALLGLATAHCGPPVATQPAPTPVYAEALTVPPIEILHESLEGGDASEIAPERDELSGEQPEDDTGQEEAPAESVPEPEPSEPGVSESAGAPRDVAAPAPSAPAAP